MKKFGVIFCALLCTAFMYGCQSAETSSLDEPAVTQEDIEDYPEPEAVATVSMTDTTGKAANGHVSSYGVAREKKDGMIKSYLTGEWVPEDIGMRRPVAVMLNNIKEAQPMTGVSAAGVIFECVVEGSLTRMMGIFEDYDKLDKIGSVRSCRNYFVYYALEFDAIYAHYGQSAYAVSLLEKDYVDNLSGLSGIGGTVFYRTSDRVAPHNAYASAKGINMGIDKLGFRKEYSEKYKGKFTFAYDDEKIKLEGDNSYAATLIKPGYLINQPWFEYNSTDGLYYRFQYGDKQIDDMNKKQLTFENVIFQYSSWDVADEKGYLGFDCHGGGKMIYFTQGRAVEGQWIRYDGDEGSVRYYDMNGEEIIVNQGKTWICIIQDTYGDKVEIK